MERREGAREAQQKSMSGVPVAGVRTMPLSFKYFVAGRKSERTMGDER